MIGNMQILCITLHLNAIIYDKINVVLVYRTLNSSSYDSVALISQY